MPDTVKKARKEKFLAELVTMEAAGNVLVACQRTGLSRSSMYDWKAEDPEFKEAWEKAVEKGKEILAEELENALRVAAVTNKNVTAIIFGLKNLRPDKWKDRTESDTTVKHTIDIDEDWIDAISKLKQKAKNESNNGGNTGK